ncbi:polysaccharide pyruvyl transferase family protein [Naasia sp. SYSU D00948]|uniref:polysaccharide pyruvyl transferase family protein n=1 Tax=Naasia sp. SYSU D00948 TaxID=2817379 RepID=UPI001B308BD4|nr:polysaccharide pyruvyl transferase family protein [Naasia sp. SYSU D00948]
MNLTRLRRRAERFAGDAWASTRLSSAGLRRAFASAPSAGRGRTHVLVAPPGGGNIGDQAMFEAFLENTEGRVAVVVTSEDDLVVPPWASGRVRVVVLPGAVYGRGSARRRDLARYRELLQEASAVSVIGADMMDGKYTIRAAVRRALLAELAALSGVPARILGFSWNASPAPGARRALRSAAAAGVVPLLRDPHSAARARGDGIPGVVETSDMVFAASSTDPALLEESGELSGLGRPYVVVNASALVGRSVDQVPEYERILSFLSSEDYEVVLLPHVLRGTSNDLDACRAVAERAAAPGVHLIERALSPAEVRALTADAAFVVTGRMHLAIMAFWSGVPAITFSTQGKVSGLMELLGVPELCVDPEPGLAGRTIELARELGESDRIRSAVRARLPHLRSLARRNFRRNPPGPVVAADPPQPVETVAP